MLDNIKNKIKLLAGLYKTYRQRVVFQKRLQTYVDYITRQAAYEKRKYGHIFDYGSTKGGTYFIGTLRTDQATKTRPPKTTAKKSKR
jgi:hypothetical protein